MTIQRFTLLHQVGKIRIGKLECSIHRIINRYIDTRCRLFRIKEFFVHNNPEAEAQRSCENALSLSCTWTPHARNSFEFLPKGICERKTPKSWKDDIYIVSYLETFINLVHLFCFSNEEGSKMWKYSNLFNLFSLSFLSW